ncbi:MAG: SGNH/GDSL hydrolase family protein [Nitrospirae bacterium]|nr:SGNH/GDSL hydrolase family protein [Nitrospirota bacterium]
MIAPDLPELDFQNRVVKYKPNQRGTYRVKDEIAAGYTINSDGWNSTYASYNKNKTPGKSRIAIIGDSYIEAFSVNSNESVAEKLENKLGSDSFEVYRFGISGAPMSQYLHMLRREVIKYHPEMVIIVLVHNDFDESYRFLKGSYGSNFMKIVIKDNNVSEIEPEHFIRPWYMPIRESATWRYLAYRQQVPYNRIKDIFLGNDAEYQANISVASIATEKDLSIITTNYLFAEMKKACDNIGAELLVIMDGDRKAIYSRINSKELYNNGALSLNSISGEAAGRNGIDFIDLHPFFEADYKEHKVKFDFKYDGHWNAYGHEIAAGVIYKHIKDMDISQNKLNLQMK